MNSTRIQIKLKESGALVPAEERTAYRLFAQGIADISENASIIGAADEDEESEVRMTIRALIEQRSKIPHGKAFAYGEKFEEAEKWLKEVLTHGLTVHGTSNINEPRIVGVLEDGTPRYQDEIVSWVQTMFPDNNLSAETIKRRLREIRRKGGLDTDGNGRYSLKSADRIHRVTA